MLYCKLCGMPLAGRWKGDFDETLLHAFIYHFDVIDNYNWDEVRDLVEKGTIRSLATRVNEE